MYLKSGDIFITSDINELPLNEIKQGRHFVLLEKKEIGFIKEKMVDSSTSMLCNEVFDDILYVMECNSSYVVNNDKNRDEDKENEENHYNEDSPLLRLTRFNRTYLNLNGELYNLGDRDGWEYGYEIGDLEGDNKQIYDLVFSSGYKWFREYKNDKFCIAYLPVSFNDNTCLVFKITSSFFGFAKWNIMCNAFFIKKDSNTEINLSVDFLSLYNKVKEIKKNFLNKEDFRKFDEVLNLINYDIIKHMKLSPLEQDEMIDKLLELAQYGVTKQQLKELFSFFYSNDDLNIKICIESVKKLNPQYIVYRDDSLISNYKLDEVMKIEILKADALYRWDNSSTKNGVDPRSGKYCKDGIQVVHYLGCYEDAGGIIYPINNYNSNYYINYDGIFVQMKQNQQEVKDLLERKRLVESLSIE